MCKLNVLTAKPGQIWSVWKGITSFRSLQLSAAGIVYGRFSTFSVLLGVTSYENPLGENQSLDVQVTCEIWKEDCSRISWAGPMFPQQHPCLCVKPLLIRFRQEMLGFVVLSCNSRRKGEFGAMPEGFRLTQQGQVSGGGIAKCGFVTYLCHSTM